MSADGRPVVTVKFATSTPVELRDRIRDFAVDLAAQGIDVQLVLVYTPEEPR